VFGDCFLEFFIYFIAGFITTWVITQKSNFLSQTKICPMKESIHNLVTCKTSDKQLMKHLKNYSLLKIQDGYFEYQEVLESLTNKNNKNDKSKS
jgi:hypothetical protein